MSPSITTTPTSAPPPVVPSQDARALIAQGDERPHQSGSTDGALGADPKEIYAEDWWGHTRPIVELHGYFRTRGELFHNFSLGRHDTPGNGLWAQPLDTTYQDTTGNPHGPNLCGDPTPSTGACTDKSQASANMRFRLEPEIHISDNLRILSQIDMLDNLVLGSTPDAYAMTPAKSGGGYASAGYNGNAPLGFFSTTQGPPTAGINSLENSINVKRAWAEYMTPVGQLRFGRMPDQWGLGMVHNAGNGIDSDWQSTVDRIMFVSGIRSADLYFGGSWDFISTGPTSQTAYSVNGGQPYDTSQLSNVFQWSLFIAHRTNPDLQHLQLTRGDLVVNGGLYTNYRTQYLDVSTTSAQTPQTISQSETGGTDNGQERRAAWELVPDAWIQVLWKKFRFEAEFAAHWGEIGNTPQSGVTLDDAVDIRQYGLATQTEFKAVEDKLHLQFGFGWASGDPWVNMLNTTSSTTGLPSELNGGRGPISTFAFHPDYRVDLIFFRNIMQSVQGAYYFRPSVDYDFLKHPDGQKFGGGAAILWDRASEFMQAPGHKRDLGVELDLQLYYQAKDGSLNDSPDKLGGFFAMLQYGVFFPLAGLGYPSGQAAVSSAAGVNVDTSAAQTVRLFLGVAY